jgi:hypothetical protein
VAPTATGRRSTERVRLASQLFPEASCSRAVSWSSEPSTRRSRSQGPRQGSFSVAFPFASVCTGRARSRFGARLRRPGGQLAPAWWAKSTRCTSTVPTAPATGPPK